MAHSTSPVSRITVGLDVGDKRIHFEAVDGARQTVRSGSFATSRTELEQALAPFSGAKVILEAGSQSPWMSRVLRAQGYDVLVADPRRVELISKDPRKSDRRDAGMLARMGAAMPELLGSVHHVKGRANGTTSGSGKRDHMLTASLLRNRPGNRTS